MKYKLCPFCGSPMKPRGVKKLPNEYDHARGCPYDLAMRKRRKLAALRKAVAR